MGVLDSLTEEDIDVRTYVRTLRPGHRWNPVESGNGVVYEVISPEGGHRFISHNSIASIKGGVYIPVWEPVLPTRSKSRTASKSKAKKPAQKTRRKNKTIQKTKRRRRT